MRTIDEGPGRMNAAELDRPPLVRARNVSKSFGGVRVLNAVDLDVLPGEIHGLLGENGSGKSTFIKVLAGFHEPDPGAELQVNGEDVPMPLAPGAFRDYGMSFVHQDLGLMPTLSVLENLRLGTFSRASRWAISWRKEAQAARELFAEFALDLDPAARVSDLSGTERALLAIVRAVHEMRTLRGGARTGPGMLILDEPTVFLPETGRRQLFALMREIAADGAAVLFVSHDLDEVREITDRVTVFRDGLLKATVDTAGVSDADLVQLIIGRELPDYSAEHVAISADGAVESELAVRVSDLSDERLRSVSFDLGAGEVLGLTGLLGSGFERVPYLLFGAFAAGSGSLEIAGEKLLLPAMDPVKAIAHRMALIPADRQRDGSVGSISVRDNAMLRVIDRYTSWRGLQRRRMARDCERTLERFDVRPPIPGIAYQSLSGGNQQKVLLAKWLSAEPEMLLLHEPTQGVDVGARAQIYRFIHDAAGKGCSVLCASSDYEQLALICDRVLIFDRGRVARELRGSEISKDRIAHECYTLADRVDPTGPAATDGQADQVRAGGR
jgi:ribose transport system ATP-binding protein